MDGFSWLIISWVVVGALCYFALNKLGTPQPENGVSLSTESSAYGASASRSQTSEWTNDLLRWLFNNLRRVPEPLEAWISSLNEAAKKVSSPSTCEILFEGFADNSSVRKPPKVSNIRMEQGPKDHLTMKSTIDVPEVNLKLVSSQRVEDRLIVSNFDAKIRDLHGEIEARLACIANQIYVMACFSGRPELDIQLTNTDSSVAGEVNSAIVEAAIRRCLVSAVTNVSLSDTLSPLNTTTTTTPTSPITPLMTRNYRQQSAERSPTLTTPTSQIVAPVQEMMKRLSQSQHINSPSVNISSQFSNAQPNKVRVKVIRAQRLGKEIDVNQPYVVVEMDEPAQKYITTKGLNMSPYWEETFDFDFTPASEEILFEIYEGEQATHDAEARFLGLAIVGFEEIRRSGERVHSFTLQGRPYRNDSVSGTLTVQFDFYHDPNVSIMGQQIDQVIVHGNDGSEFRETLTTSRRPIYDPHDSLEGRDLIPTKTTTVTVKGVSQQLKDKPLISSVHSSMESPMDPVTPRTLEQTFQRAHTDEGYDNQRYDGSTGFAGNQTATTTATTSLKQTTASSMPSVPTSQTTTTTTTTTQQHSPTYQVSQQTIRSQQQPQPGKTAQLIQISHHPKDSSTANEQGKVQTQAQSPSHYPSPTYQEQRAVLANKASTTPSPIIQQQQQSTPLTPTDDPTRISRDRFKKPTVEGDATERRERSFFGELRDRLSGRRRSKRRAKSFDLGNEELEEAVSLPPSRDQSRTRNKEEKHISRSHHETSSVGEKSGISSKSLYQHSTLVLETTKDSKKRYYLIPPSIVDEPAAGRLMKHGKKLHIYNDHIFVAVKLRGGTTCNVCHHRIARSFAKQAYQCRDCRLVCHKTCHYKTESYCTASTVSKLDISKDVDWPHFLQHYEFEEFISSDGV